MTSPKYILKPTCAPWLLGLGLGLATMVAGARADEPDLGPMQLAQRQIVIDDRGADSEAALDELSAEGVVKGAPYCADAVHETIQWLPDGNGGASNKIVHAQRSRMCRDGEGRTRQEVERGGHAFVFLSDPVAHESWMLDPERRTARRLGTGGFHVGASSIDRAVWREYGERMREWARQMATRAREMARAESRPLPPTPPAPPAPLTPPTPPEPVVLVQPHEHDGRTAVQVIRMGEGDAADAAPDWPAPPAVQWRAQLLAPRGAGVVSPLGSKDVEGVRADGVRTTWTIEAGKIGNDKPIQITRDVWTAPSLVLTVLSRDFDPRRGEVVYRLANLRRGEPDAALMRVPAGFERKGEPGERGDGHGKAPSGASPRGRAPASAASAAKG